MRRCIIYSIDLSENDIGDKGGILFAEWIENNRIIQKINLKNNLIQLDGGKAIRNALFNSSSTNLIYLNLVLNPIDIKLAEEIEDMIYGTVSYSELNILIINIENKMNKKKDTSRLRFEKNDYRNDKELLKKTLKGKSSIIYYRNFIEKE